MRETLKRYIVEQLLSDRDRRIDDDEDLLDTGIDSVGMATFVLFIEGEWDLVIPPEDVILENFQTVSRIEGYLRARLDGG